MNFARWIMVAFLGLVGTPALADVANGHMLYDSICSTCHGPAPGLGGPELAAGNPTRIQNAINSVVPAMRFLKGPPPVLSNTDINDIAAYLATFSSSPPPPPPPPGPVAPLFNATDLWWNPLESGWGFNIVQSPTTNNIFAVMFTYDVTTKETWFILPGGTWNTPTLFTGGWYKVSGPLFNAPGQHNLTTIAGAATLQFSDANHATLTFTVDGVTTTKTMVRLDF